MPACYFEPTQLAVQWSNKSLPGFTENMFILVVCSHTRVFWKVLHIIQLPSTSACLPVSDVNTLVDRNSGYCLVLMYEERIVDFSCKFVPITPDFIFHVLISIFQRWSSSVPNNLLCSGLLIPTVNVQHQQQTSVLLMVNQTSFLCGAVIWTF